MLSIKAIFSFSKRGTIKNALAGIVFPPRCLPTGSIVSQLSGSSNRVSLGCVEAQNSTSIGRKSFPEGFLFGVGSSAYQYEGAAFEDGKGHSIWDYFTHNHSDKILDGSNGDVAEDFYHRYKSDVQLMKAMGIDSFRFSISWPRVIPTGKIENGTNRLGIQFYNNLIDELLANGLIPMVTLYHWDLPQTLQEEYGGFLSEKVIDDFLAFANVCFKEFGDRVKHWGTFNEPNLSTQFGYAEGSHAPGRCSDYIGNCPPGGNSGTEPYIVVHNLLLCHAAAVNLYRTTYKSQQGIIGLTVASEMVYPLNQTHDNIKAALRALDFTIGWVVEPIVYGRYPESMLEILGSRLPMFTSDQSALLKNSYDYIGLNYYSSHYAFDTTSSSNPANLSYTTDSLSEATFFHETGEPIGEPTVLPWLYIYPQGIRDVLIYMKEKYNNPNIIITENGMADPNHGTLAEYPQALNDTARISYHHDHFVYLLKAINEGVKVIGYYGWTFLDDFEWGSGYTLRFGFNFVDWNNGLKRYPKSSYYWFKNFLAN